MDSRPHATPRVRIDFIDAEGRASSLAFAQPERIIEAWHLDDVRSALAAGEAEAARGHYVAGFVAYEAAAAFDTALVTKPPSDLPLVWFGVFHAPVPSAPAAGTDADPGHPASVSGEPVWTSDVTAPDYHAAIARIREAIAAGDTYQINYTFRLKSQLDVASLGALYTRLVADKRVPYAAWLDLGRWRVLSLSPELFFRLEGDRLTSSPMKGTIPRGLFDADDTRQREMLRQSPKNRAENVMIVDLVRNDIGRVARTGSVQVASLFDVEPYPHVLQMTSTVTGRVRPGTSLTDVFAALFPAGSITGAPKTSSMRLIARLERAPRGIYCGAIGVIRPGGDAVFNVAIRTAVVDASTGAAELGVGGGVTWDSTPGDEHVEALSKASFLRAEPSFDLIETMRLESGRFVRIDGHLQRLQTSARYFGFDLDRAAIVEAIEAEARDHALGTWRARLRVSRRGRIDIVAEPFDPQRSEPAPVALASSPVSTRDRFLYHKTTERAVYDHHRQQHPDAFDVLLWNEHDQLTEFTIGNVVVEIDGRRWTPPQSCGLLAGVFRQALIASGDIEERVLTRADLPAASRIWLINSLREWVRVRLRT